MRAVNNDKTNELRWSRKGGLLMLDIARGLTFLHANRVSQVCLFLLCLRDDSVQFWCVTPGV
jgi:hypothetical protein